MLLMGRALSLLAALILPRRRRRLEQALREIYAKYCMSMKDRTLPVLVMTLIAAEDHRFYRHGGIDPIAIGRAIWRLAVRRSWHGGSTLEQQLVRTVTDDYKRSFRRKAQEILLASLVYKVVPKSDIPGVYLSVAYFGWRMNGIAQACDRLAIDFNRMTREQAASVVARLKYPEPKVASSERTHQIKARCEYIVRLTARRCPNLAFTATEALDNETVQNF